MLRNKNDVSTVFPAFIQHVKTQYHSEITIIPTDDAPELIFAIIFKNHGLVHQFPCAYMPQENFVVELKHQHQLNIIRALLFQSSVSLECLHLY